jgi:hypothetical protein
MSREGRGIMKTLRVLPLLVLSVVMVRSAAAAEPDDKAGFEGGNIPAKNTIDPKPLEAILGRRAAQVKDGVAEFLFAPKATTYGTAVGEAITWATFGGNLQAAVVDGDFAIPEDELQDVLQALRRANINIGELHNHMKQEEPRIVFLHFWAKGPAEGLARSLKSVLDTQRGGTEPPFRFFRKLHFLEKTEPWYDPKRFPPEV